LLAKLPRAGDKSEKEKCIVADILEESNEEFEFGGRSEQGLLNDKSAFYL
jgi:hypothetical protein